MVLLRVMTFLVTCKQRWCSSVDDECVWKGGVGGYWRSLLLANKDDVRRWVMNVFGRPGGVGWGGYLTFVVTCKQRWCSSVHDECVWKGGVGSGGGGNDVRCYLQTKMMFFGGWWMCLEGWGGVGGGMRFVVTWKQRWCSYLQTKMMSRRVWPCSLQNVLLLRRLLPRLCGWSQPMGKTTFCKHVSSENQNAINWRHVKLLAWRRGC